MIKPLEYNSELGQTIGNNIETVLPNFKPSDMVSNQVKGTGKVLITINEERKAFVAWSNGSRSWVAMGELDRVQVS